jgi:hypothetical protein
MYIVFRVQPWPDNIAQSLLKELKLYFFDSGLVDNGPLYRLGNQVAVSLLAYAWFRTDRTGSPSISATCEPRTAGKSTFA